MLTENIYKEYMGTCYSDQCYDKNILLSCLEGEFLVIINNNYYNLYKGDFIQINKGDVCSVYFIVDSTFKQVM